MRLSYRHITIIIIITIIMIILPPSQAEAAEIATESAAVSATVPASTPTGDTTAPTAPILIYPTDGSYSSDSTPEFIWRKSTDTNSNTVLYTFYLNGVAKFLGISNVGNSSGTGFTTLVDGDQIRLTPTAYLPDGRYDWKVSAYDASGNESFSTQWSITIDTVKPPIKVTDIDTHHQLKLSSLDPSSIPEGTIFDIAGPKEVALTVVTDTYTSISISFATSDGTVIGPVSGYTANQTYVTLYQYLEIGKYQVHISATDHASLVTILPPFHLDVMESQIIIIPLPLPRTGESGPPTVTLPPRISQVITALYSYPATVARIASRDSIALLYIASLAILVGILLIFLKKRYNLVFLTEDRKPYLEAEIVVRGVNKKYTLDPQNRGRLYVPGLRRGSELIIEHGKASVRLCLSRSAHRYIIIL